MDKTLLKKAAIQSVTLMLAVITASYALKQYQTVTIEASNVVTIDNSNESMEENIGELDLDHNMDMDRDEEMSDAELGSEEELSELDQLLNQINPVILEQLSDNFLIIKKPQGELQEAQLEDLYINKSIRLTVAGIGDSNLTSEMVLRVRDMELYHGEPICTEHISYEIDEKDGTSEEIITKDFGKDIVHGLTITTEESSDTGLSTMQLLIELDHVYAYHLYEDNDYYVINLRKPSEVYDKIVVIDAGHGGKDAGALSKDETYYEKNINLDILLQLKELLDQENIKVYYTRTADDKIFLRPRAELANAVDCDYFISIHCNANEVTYPNGTEILYYNNEFKGVKAIDLADLFSEEIDKTTALVKQGVVEKQYNDVYIMDKAVVPMVLIEVGYLTNNSDMNYLSKPENRKEVAEGIYNGILRAYNELPVTETK